MTSLVFMLVLVPAPPWMTPTTNCSCSSPSTIRWQTASMMSAFAGSRTPISLLARADACLTRARAPHQVGVVADRAPRDREVDEGPRGVDAPVDVLGDLHRSERVALGAGGPAAGQLLRGVFGAVGGDVVVTVDELLGHRVVWLRFAWAMRPWCARWVLVASESPLTVCLPAYLPPVSPYRPRGVCSAGTIRKIPNATTNAQTANSATAASRRAAPLAVAEPERPARTA